MSPSHTVGLEHRKKKKPEHIQICRHPTRWAWNRLLYLCHTPSYPRRHPTQWAWNWVFPPERRR